MSAASERRAREELLELQIEVRQIDADLADVNDEMRTHPKKPVNGNVSEAGLDEWRDLKAGFDAEKASLKERRSIAADKRDNLLRRLSHEPVSLVTLSLMLNKLTEVEAKFTTEDAREAWDSLTSFIDWLDAEYERLKRAA